MDPRVQLIWGLRASPLPYELWEQILHQLPRSDQRACLGVSKIVHDVALPLVFSRITVFFGCWQFANDPVALEYSTWSQQDRDAHKRNLNTTDLLRHIVQEPEFAKLVKEMSVAAFAFPYAIAERTSLLEALRHLNLSSFLYYGKHPALDTDIMGALAAGSGPTLRELRVPCTLDLPKSYYFSCFPRLQTTIIVTIDPESTVGGRKALMECVMESTSPPLRLSTRVPEWGPPGARLESSLRELELTNLAGYTKGIEPILAFTRLRSLVLVGARAYHLLALRAHPTSLPLLHAFKLVPKADNVSRSTYSAFLMEKKHLTRLDVKYSSNLIEIIPHDALSSIKVLGVDLGSLARATDATDVFESLDAHLPRNLSALLVHRASIRKRAGLRYIHFIEPGYATGGDDHLQELCDDLPPGSSLELVGDGSRMRWVLAAASSRADSEGVARSSTHVLSEPWPLSTVLFRRPGDFSLAKVNDDWEWLLRHHDAAMFGEREPD
ncbi:hypothetical protein C8Q80DRAFT_1272944 [Daedaleopsis nitida]|nr:hypothetical protein C8Q80DRAFT_1272944 [Daedaleopsis nitida]